MSDSGNIFLTTENLAFSMPLILVCTTYAYFKFIPLKYGIPIILVVVVLFQIRSALRSMKEKRITNMDDDAILELVGEEETKSDAGAANKKKKAAVKARLAAEKKAAAKKGKAASEDAGLDDLDEDDLLKFANKKTK